MLLIAVIATFYVLQLTLGVCAVALLERYRRSRVTAYAFAGMAIVLLPFGGSYWWTIAAARYPLSAQSVLWDLLPIVAYGLLIGLSYWIIARPDRSGNARPEQISTIFR